MNKENRMSAVDIDKNDEKMDVIARKINGINQTKRRRRIKIRQNPKLSLRLSELKELKTDFRDNIDALKQIVLHIEESKVQVKLENKQLKRKIKIFPGKNPFDFAKCLEMQKEENEIDLSFFPELAEKSEIIYNQAPVNTLVEVLGKLKNSFLQMVILVYVTKKREIDSFLKIVVNWQNS